MSTVMVTNTPQYKHLHMPCRDLRIEKSSRIWFPTETIGDFVLSPYEGHATCDGGRVELSPVLLRMLRCVLLGGKNGIPRKDLADSVWTGVGRKQQMISLRVGTYRLRQLLSGVGRALDLVYLNSTTGRVTRRATRNVVVWYRVTRI